ncbi:MAG: DNA polymerase III subunit delta [Pseudomonadota bacterium]
MAAPSPDVGAALIYGPDSGLVRERATAISLKVTPDLKDPFNAIEFTDQDLKADPARLADEAAALSFSGGRRLIRLRTSGDAASGAAKRLIDGLDGGYLKANALVVIEAGDLAKSSKLRKMFETAKLAVAIPCYEDKPQDVAALAESMASEHGLSFEEDALGYAASLLGIDRGVSRAELEKLIAFVGPKGVARETDAITVDDVRACLVDTTTDAVDEVAGAALDGRQDKLSVALRRSAGAGASEIGLLRGLQRGVTRLSAAQDAIATGSSPRDAMKRLRPPVFFAEQNAFSARLRAWPKGKLAAAMDLLLDAEAAAKSTGAPQRAIAERAAMRVAHLARR